MPTPPVPDLPPTPTPPAPAEAGERVDRVDRADRSDRGVRPVLMALAALALGAILLPLYGPILWGGVIALLFAPLHRRLCRALGQRRSVAALLTLAVALVAVLLPLAALLRALGGQAWQVYDNVRSGVWQPSQLLHSTFDGLPAWLRSGLRQLGLADFATVQRRIDAGLAEASRFAATQAFGVGQDTLGAVAGTGIALYLAFFMLRDGAALAGTLQRAMPLPPAQARTLIDRYAAVVRATVKGHLLVAAVQGLLGGLAFWALGLDAVVLWAAAMAALSLVPLVGAALIWGPVAVYLLATGSTAAGLGLLAWGVGVVGLVDNLLRPRLIGRDTRLPEWAVLVTTLGGLSVFGINGLLLGPAIGAMAVAVWQLLPVVNPRSARRPAFGPDEGPHDATGDA